MFGSLGPTELIIILVIVLIIFGAGRLADVGGALGRGISEFRKATQDDASTDTSQPEEKEAETV